MCCHLVASFGSIQPCQQCAKTFFEVCASLSAALPPRTSDFISYCATVAVLASTSRLWAGTRLPTVALLRTFMVLSPNGLGSASIMSTDSPSSKTASNGESTPTILSAEPAKKLHGRAFYESIGSPKFVLAPMVDQSEFVRPSPPLLNDFR